MNYVYNNVDNIFYRFYKTLSKNCVPSIIENSSFKLIYEINVQGHQ